MGSWWTGRWPRLFIAAPIKQVPSTSKHIHNHLHTGILRMRRFKRGHDPRFCGEHWRWSLWCLLLSNFNNNPWQCRDRGSQSIQELPKIIASQSRGDGMNHKAADGVCSTKTLHAWFGARLKRTGVINLAHSQDRRHKCFCLSQEIGTDSHSELHPRDCGQYFRRLFCIEDYLSAKLGIPIGSISLSCCNALTSFNIPNSVTSICDHFLVALHWHRSPFQTHSLSLPKEIFWL